MHVVESKGLATALVAGVGAMYLMNQTPQASLQFGAIAALGVSVGDSMTTGFGINSEIGSYITTDTHWQNYVDPMDFIGGMVGTALIAYGAGIAEGRELALYSGLGAVGAGVAPKIVGYINKNYGAATDATGQISV